MAVETDADRDIFFDADDFGVTAIVTPTSGDPFEIDGIFLSPHETRGLRQGNQYNSGAMISGQDTQFRTKSTLVANIKASTQPRITIEGVVYVVHDVKPDGTGLTTLNIKRA